ncbi:hypothetical protein M9979_15730 [Sphingomonas sp. RP10(2022)]|uniref:PRC-barrel domain-containing protein n=1 Tax=Sphingomonas liriopis TaxID=2949094 RepID=A0A9X2HVL3_9SPHN|nr:hypothetical protein [Sphingomonas liriopis]MCP3736319.1 hypothetical protein [Sphingomonas liriopis]
MRTLALTIGSLIMVPAAALAQQAQPGRTPMPAPTQTTTPATGAAAQTGAAATATAPTVGATIYDSAGVALGTVASITPQAVVLNTGTAQVPVPPTSIGKTDKGFAMAMTKADLDAAVASSQAQAQAAVKSKLVPGTSVSGLQGATLGTIKSADAQFVTVTTAKGDVKLPIAGFSADASGKVIVGITADQLAAATAGATTSAPTK